LNFSATGTPSFEAAPRPPEVVPKPKKFWLKIALAVIVVVVVLGAVFAYWWFSKPSPSIPWLFKGAYGEYEGSTTVNSMTFEVTLRFEVVDFNATHGKLLTYLRMTNPLVQPYEDQTTTWSEIYGTSYETPGATLVSEHEDRMSFERFGTRSCTVLKYAYQETEASFNMIIYVDKETGWPLRIQYDYTQPIVCSFDLKLVETNIPRLARERAIVVQFQPKGIASFTVDGVEYYFWAAVVNSSPYGTGNMVVVYKKISVYAYNYTVYVDSENLLLGEKYGWLTSQVYPARAPGNFTFEGVQSASIIIEETTDTKTTEKRTYLTATVSGPISLSIVYTPYGDNSTFIEDPGDSPHLYDYDGDGFSSYSTRRECNASGVFNGHQLLGFTNFNWGRFDIVDHEWYDLAVVGAHYSEKEGSLQEISPLWYPNAVLRAPRQIWRTSLPSHFFSQLSSYLRNLLNRSTSDGSLGSRLHHTQSWANNLTVGFKSLIAGRKSLKVSYHARCSSL